MEPDRSGLIATPIVDRRGRLTTVHRKPEGTQKSVRRSELPAPQPKLMSNKAAKASLLKESLGNEHSCGLTGCRSKTCVRGINSVALINAFVQGDERAQECLARQIPEGMRLDESSPYIYRESFLNYRAVYSLLDEKGDVQEKFAIAPITLNRAKMRERIEKIDKSIVPSFDSVEELKEFVTELYGDTRQDTVTFLLSPKDRYEDGKRVEPVLIYSVSELRVAHDLRGLGVGRHIMDMTTKFADEHGITLTLVPTEAGDGTYIEGEEGYQENRRSHYFRIKRFYEGCGFVASPFFRSVLTFDDQSEDPEAVGRLNKSYLPLLEFASMIREPHGGYPSGMFRR